MKHFSFVFALFFPFLILAQSSTVVHDGLTREYNFRIPPGYDSGTPSPMVINYHGAGSNASQQEFYTGFTSVANSNNFIVVYPEGIDNVWNSGAITNNIDDVGFTSALIDKMALSYNIDPNRIYACGMSNGGFMSYRLACELEDRIAAIASVTGLLANAIAQTCQNNRPVPVMQMHGTADPTVDYNGVTNVYYSVDETMDFWTMHNDCMAPEVVTEVPDTDPNDDCTTTHFYYGGCDNSTEVELYRINGGEHTWPDAIINIGVTSHDFDGSQTIWDFFTRHSLNGPISDVKTFNNMAARIKLNPNPASNMVRLDLPVTSEAVNVYNLRGQLVFSAKNERTSLDIATADWLPGIYFIEVLGKAGKLSVEKLVIQ